MRNVDKNSNDHAINSRDNKKHEVENIWIVKSGCHFSCIEASKGIQIVNSRLDGSTNIQLCSPEKIVCISKIIKMYIKYVGFYLI